MQAITAFSRAEVGALTSAMETGHSLAQKSRPLRQEVSPTNQLTSNRHPSRDVPESVDGVQFLVLVPRIVDQRETLVRPIRPRVLLVKRLGGHLHLQVLAVPVIGLPEELGVGFGWRAHGAGEDVKDGPHHLVLPRPSAFGSAFLGNAGRGGTERVDDLTEFETEFPELGGDDLVDRAGLRRSERFWVDGLGDDSVFLATSTAITT
jgi:hypothetical protein